MHFGQSFWIVKLTDGCSDTYTFTSTRTLTLKERVSCHSCHGPDIWKGINDPTPPHTSPCLTGQAGSFRERGRGDGRVFGQKLDCMNSTYPTMGGDVNTVSYWLTN